MYCLVHTNYLLPFFLVIYSNNIGGTRRWKIQPEKENRLQGLASEQTRSVYTFVVRLGTKVRSSIGKNAQSAVLGEFRT